MAYILVQVSPLTAFVSDGRTNLRSALFPSLEALLTFSEEFLRYGLCEFLSVFPQHILRFSADSLVLSHLNG